MALFREFFCFTASSFSFNQQEFSNVYYLKESQYTASHCESQSVPVTWAQSILGDCILRERQKEPGALYKLLAVVEGLEVQRRVSYGSILTTLSLSDLGSGSSSQATLVFRMFPRPGLAL